MSFNKDENGKVLPMSFGRRVTLRDIEEDLESAESDMEEGIALLEEFLQEMEEERVSEELSLIEEYDKEIQCEERYLASMVEEMEEGQSPVICPICHVNNLTVIRHFTACPCGLYINTKNKNVTAEVLQTLLKDKVSEHMEDCLNHPVFSTTANPDGSSNLLIGCQDCDFQSVVL